MPLDSFQREVLERFFRHERRFFLTGGAALVGYYLDHRTTKDLDLFTCEDALDDGVAALRLVAAELGASIETVQTTVTFRRFLLVRGPSSVVVDLVHDLAPQVVPTKPERGDVRVDSIEEIVVNKVCALLSRAELRDLVDLRELLARGHSLEDAVIAARRKDGGMTAGQLAWVLSDLRIGDDATPPGGVTVAELREFLGDLTDRLARMAHPAGDPA